MNQFHQLLWKWDRQEVERRSNKTRALRGQQPCNKTERTRPQLQAQEALISTVLPKLAGTDSTSQIKYVFVLLL